MLALPSMHTSCPEGPSLEPGLTRQSPPMNKSGTHGVVSCSCGLDLSWERRGGVFQVQVFLTDLPYQICTRLLASNTVDRNVVMHGYVQGAAYETLPFVTAPPGLGTSGNISYDQAMTACTTADTTGIGANNDGRVNAFLIYRFSGN